MSVINYLNTDRYILIIINQNRSAIWGTQDSLVKGYRPWPKINPAGNKVAGFEYTKDTALNDGRWKFRKGLPIQLISRYKYV